MRAPDRVLVGTMALALAALACGEPTQVTVELSTDVAAPTIASVHVYAGREPVTTLPSVPQAIAEGAWGADGQIGSLVVVPEADRSAALEIVSVLGVSKPTADCKLENPTGCIVARRRLRFVERRALHLPIRLHAGCTGVLCTQNATCAALGRCISSTVDVGRCRESGDCDLENMTNSSSCRGLSFNGESQFADIMDAAEFDDFGPMTIEAWAYAEETGHEVQIISHHRHAESGWVLLVFGGSQVQYRMYDGQNQPNGFHKISWGAWHHIAGSFDGQTMRLYIDGKEESSRDFPAGRAFDYEGPVRIGGASYNAKPFAFRGVIDEVRVSMVARYTADFVPATRFEPDADTVALWHLDENSGQVIEDATGRHPGHLGSTDGLDENDPVRVGVPCRLVPGAPLN